LNAENETATDIPFVYVARHNCPDDTGAPIVQQVLLNDVAAMGDATSRTSAGSTLGAASNPPGCPSLAFLSGHFVPNVTSTENITAMTCIQGLEEVQADTIFVISQGSVQVKSEPVVDESSARWLQAFNSTYWFTNDSTFQPFSRDVGDSYPEYFFSQVHYGPDGIPAEELAGPANTQRFIDATQRVYRRYMAQLIHATMRQNLSSSAGTEAEPAPQYPGTVSGVDRLRLKQDAASKLILQILLGIMLAGGLFVYSRSNMRTVLPHCPWSIVGTMRLLAGSEMVERTTIPAGGEFMSDRELTKVFEGYLFSLGWWDTAQRRGTNNSPGGQRRFGIDIRKTDASAKP
jgi:hypothetical protein